MAKRGRPVGSKNKKSVRFHSTSKPMGVEKRKSTRATVIAHLEKFGYITKKSAEDLYNVNNFYQVISNLRGDGFHIELKRGVNGVAEYHLLNEKDLFQDATVDTCGIEEAMTCFTNWDEAIKEMEKKNAKKKVEKPEVKPEPSLKVNKNRQEAVLEHLKTHGSINGFEARDKYGCTFLPCIIRDLRKNGYKITTSKTRNSKENNPIFDREVSCCTYYLSQEDVVESKNLKPEP